MSEQSSDYVLNLTVSQPNFGSGTAYPADGLPTGVEIWCSKSETGGWTVYQRVTTTLGGKRAVWVAKSLKEALVGYAKLQNLVGYARVQYAYTRQPRCAEVLIRPLHTFRPSDFVHIHSVPNPLALRRGYPVTVGDTQGLVESVVAYEPGAELPEDVPVDLREPGCAVFRITTTDGVLWTVRERRIPEPSPTSPPLVPTVVTVTVGFTVTQADVKAAPTTQAELDARADSIRTNAAGAVAELLRTHPVFQDYACSVTSHAEHVH